MQLACQFLLMPVEWVIQGLNVTVDGEPTVIRALALPLSPIFIPLRNPNTSFASNF